MKPLFCSLPALTLLGPISCTGPILMTGTSGGPTSTVLANGSGSGPCGRQTIRIEREVPANDLLWAVHGKLFQFNTTGGVQR
jgi:hypothetical protein